MKTEVGGFPITYQNNIGNTVLHNAVTIQDLKLFKLVVCESYSQGVLDKATIADLKGNYRQNLAKCLTLKNHKGLTPLNLAIEQGGSQIFKLLLDLYLSTEAINPVCRSLTSALVMPDSSMYAETPIIKMVRKDRFNLFDILMENAKKYVKYDEVLCLKDAMDRNVLHYAVQKEHPEIVKRLVYYDSDHHKLRNQ